MAAWLAVAGPAAPSPVERALQERYLDAYFLLRADVKVQVRDARRVYTSTFPSTLPPQEVRPITLVTPEGVFHSDDFDRTTELSGDLRRTPVVGGSGTAVYPFDPTMRDVTGNVVALEWRPQVAFPAGELVRVEGAEEVDTGVRLTLTGLGREPVSVLLRELQRDPAQPLEERLERLTGMLGHLVYLLPVDPAGRRAQVNPEWPEAIRAAIAAGEVQPGMTPLQVLMSWGNPVVASRSEDGRSETWLYKRGATLREQLRSQSLVTFAGGRVEAVEGPALP